jgi:hypothetical protein
MHYQNILTQAPGGRDHAKFVPRSIFEDISLPHADGNFFLRPDQILAVFMMDMEKVPNRSDWYFNDMELEKEIDLMMEKDLSEFEALLKLNVEHVEKGIRLVLPRKEPSPGPMGKIKDCGEGDDDDDDDGSRIKERASLHSFFTSAVRRGSKLGTSMKGTSSKKKDDDIELNNSHFQQYVTNQENDIEEEGEAEKGEGGGEGVTGHHGSQRKSLSSWDKTQTILKSKKDHVTCDSNQVSSDVVPRDSSEVGVGPDVDRGFDL